ncbi:MAG: DUF1294 domain-containing protein [Clostridia bacterium]|nr:DUF1294 domain-containing protein [Clostridia bacterium]
MNLWQYLLLGAFVLMSLVGFLSMGIDKNKARKGKWRTKEATLFLCAALFGGVGSTIGMLAFRHKTKHWYFKTFFPIFAAIDIAVLVVGLIFLGKIA